MASIKLKGDTSGEITISSPSVAGTNTLTLPASTGTLVTTATSGKVLQVVTANYSTQATSSTTTYADTGLTATITPSLSTSKVLVVVHQNGGFASAGATTNGLLAKLLRGATDLAVFCESVGYTATALQQYVATASITYLDSPATTSATTYKTQFKNVSATSVAVFQAGGLSTSTITLMEIGV